MERIGILPSRNNLEIHQHLYYVRERVLCEGAFSVYIEQLMVVLTKDITIMGNTVSETQDTMPTILITAIYNTYFCFETGYHIFILSN